MSIPLASMINYYYKTERSRRRLRENISTFTWDRFRKLCGEPFDHDNYLHISTLNYRLL